MKRSLLIGILVSICLVAAVAIGLGIGLGLKASQTTQKSLNTTVIPSNSTVIPAAIPSDKLTLQDTQETAFKIVQLADLHFGEAPESFGAIQDNLSNATIAKILAMESPDLVVFSGDQITGEFMKSDALPQVLKNVFASVNVPFASIYGNRDSGPEVDRKKILKLEQENPLSLTRQDTPDSVAGVTNYYLPIYDTDPSNNDPKMLLFFLDSNGAAWNAPNTFKSIQSSQISWFLTTHEKLTQSKSIPTIVFFHIPTQSFQDLEKKDNTGKTAFDKNPSRCQGLNDEPQMDLQDSNRIIDALFQRNVLTAYIGHQHGNGWCCDTTKSGKTLQLCFGRHSGYGGYGKWARGARVINISRKNLEKNTTPSTYIRMENGTIVDAIQ